MILEYRFFHILSEFLLFLNTQQKKLTVSADSSGLRGFLVMVATPAFAGEAFLLVNAFRKPTAAVQGGIRTLVYLVPVIFLTGVKNHNQVSKLTAFELIPFPKL